MLVFSLFCNGCTCPSSLKNIGSLFTSSSEKTEIEVENPEETETTKLYTIVVNLPVNSSISYVNGEKVVLDTPPAYVNEQEITMVPLKFISDILGAKIEWFPNTKEISILQRDGEIILQINNTIAYVNGTEYLMSSPPVINEECSFVPLKFVASQLKFEVEWIPETKTVILKK